MLVQEHCHYKSVLGVDAEQRLLRRMGVAPHVPPVSCCGLAGPFGFEAPKHELSMQIGEQVLFPAVRDASEDTVIIADGFSCRTQIEQGTRRRAVHLAQFVRAQLASAGARMRFSPLEEAFAGSSDLKASLPARRAAGRARRRGGARRCCGSGRGAAVEVRRLT